MSFKPRGRFARPTRPRNRRLLSHFIEPRGTLEHVLLEFDNGMLETALKRAYETVKSRHAKDKGFDTGCPTQNLLQKLGSVARGFNDVKRRAGEPASQSDSTNLSMS